MTTLENLLHIYEGRIGLSTPLPLQRVYGKRLNRIHWLTSRFVEYRICSSDAAHMLCYQLAIDKLRWRAAKRRIRIILQLIETSPQNAEDHYASLHQQLTELLSPETPP